MASKPKEKKKAEYNTVAIETPKKFRIRELPIRAFLYQCECYPIGIVAPTKKEIIDSIVDKAHPHRITRVTISKA